MTYKGTLRQVFIRDCRYSHFSQSCWYFDLALSSSFKIVVPNLESKSIMRQYVCRNFTVVTKVRQLSSAAASAGLKTSSCSGCPCRCPGCPLAERLSQEVKAGSWSPSSSNGPRERKNASYTALGETPSLTEGRLGPPGEGDRPKVSITCSGRKRNMKIKQSFLF